MIYIWEDDEFFLNIPKTFIGTNKPFIYFYYLNPKSNKTERIRKYIGKNDGNLKQIKEEAKICIKDAMALLLRLKLFSSPRQSKMLHDCHDIWSNISPIAYVKNIATIVLRILPVPHFLSSQEVSG